MRWLWALAAVIVIVAALIWIERAHGKPTPRSWSDRAGEGASAPAAESGHDSGGQVTRLLPASSADYTVAGRVVEGDGRPVGGAEVWLSQVESCCVRAAARSTTSGPDGRFVFDGVTMGMCTVTATSGGYAHTSIGVPSGEEAVEVVLRRPASIDGLVVDSDGRPIAARVYRISDGLMMPIGGYDWDEVDASGRFRYEGRLPGEFRLRAVTSDGLEGELSIDLKEGDVLRDLRLRVAAPWRSQLRLRPVVAEGAPRDVSFHCDEEPRIESHGDVSILLFREPPGTDLRVHVGEKAWAKDGGRDADCVLATVPLTDLAVVEVFLPEPVRVRLEADPPSARPSAEFWHDDVPEFQDRGETWFMLSPARSYDVRVTAKGFLPVEIRDWRPPADGGVLSVRFQPASAIKGVVVDAQGAPIAGARVYVGSAESEAKTDPHGRFVIGTVPEGEHIVIACLNYSKVADVLVRTEPGDTTEVGALVAQPQRALTGRVIDEMGRPVGGARVTFVSVLRSERYPESMSDSEATYSHSDGTYGFDVPGLDGFLLAEKKGYGTTPASLARGAEIVLRRPAFVQVDATRKAKGDGVAWTCSIRWPDLVPEAQWDVDMWLPHTVEVAPGKVEVMGNFDQYPMSDLKAQIAGKRTRIIEVAQGETAEVIFER